MEKSWRGPNEGGIKRGDRAATGDDQAQHEDGVGREGSGVPGGDGGATGHVTGATDSLAEPVEGFVDTDDAVEEISEDLEPFEIMDADDPRLGLTDVLDRPAEDWAANTGPSNDAEQEEPAEVQSPPLEVPQNRKRKK